MSSLPGPPDLHRAISDTLSEAAADVVCGNDASMSEKGKTLFSFVNQAANAPAFVNQAAASSVEETIAFILRKKYRFVQEKVNSGKQPTPQQLGEFLKLAVAELKSLISDVPNLPSVVGVLRKLFADLSWDYDKNKSKQSTAPPSAAQVALQLLDAASLVEGLADEDEQYYDQEEYDDGYDPYGNFDQYTAKGRSGGRAGGRMGGARAISGGGGGGGTGKYSAKGVRAAEVNINKGMARTGGGVLG